MSGDPAEFLAARYAEDEAIAKAAAEQTGSAEWWGLSGPGLDDDTPEDVRQAWANLAAFEKPRDKHVIRHDPARALREVAAKRAILELHEGAHECPIYDHNGDIDNCGWVPDGDCPTKAHLAAVYSDHPGYDPSWAPELNRR